MAMHIEATRQMLARSPSGPILTQHSATANLRLPTPITRHAPPAAIFTPAAVPFRAAVVDDRVPIAIGFGLVFGVD
jgi:hypothetical protein